jgi:hypothetical protein
MVFAKNDSFMSVDLNRIDFDDGEGLARRRLFNMANDRFNLQRAFSDA